MGDAHRVDDSEEHTELMDEKELTVSSSTNTIKLADSIYKTLLEGHRIVLTAAGHYAINQMTKALAIARGKLLQKGRSIVWYTYFEDAEGRETHEHITVMRTRIVDQEA